MFDSSKLINTYVCGFFTTSTLLCNSYIKCTWVSSMDLPNLLFHMSFCVHTPIRSLEALCLISYCFLSMMCHSIHMHFFIVLLTSHHPRQLIFNSALSARLNNFYAVCLLTYIAVLNAYMRSKALTIITAV